MHQVKFKVAGFVTSMQLPESIWIPLSSHYLPFATDAAPQASISISFDPEHQDLQGYASVYVDERSDEDVKVDYLTDTDNNYKFVIRCPYKNAPKCVLYINKERTEAKAFLVSTADRCPQSIVPIVSTCAIQLSFMLFTANAHRLLSHSSCVVKDGKAYMFIAKSGTGKSTHSRLWLENIPGTFLLNDDHPIVSVDGSEAIAYGSPWSGKTDCYVNAQAPIGGIVRIKRAPHNHISHLSVVRSYASVSTSFSGLSFVPEIADLRHASLERLIERVPCYELECLPDSEAAIVCYNEFADK